MPPTALLIEQLRNRLQQPLPGRPAQERMTGRVLPMPDQVPDNVRHSAVLALLFLKEEKLQLLLMRRTEDGGVHSGQISFPGGSREPADADLQATALREAQEEVGINPDDVDVLGALTPMYIPVSNFMVYPYVGFTDKPLPYALSEAEVVEVLEVPLEWLLDVAVKIETEVRPSSRPGMVLHVPAYSLPGGYLLWGATAMIFSELEVCLEGLF